MNSIANWIWIPQDDGTRNLTACFRRAFSLDRKPQTAYLEISADSRYVLYINNQRVGQGPARSWNHLKQYDRYEVSRYLIDDTNIIAVQVVRWGIESGQYEGGPGGLIAQLTLGDNIKPEWVTDDSWKTAIHPSYTPHVPRLSWGNAFSEQYDACFDMGDWRELGFLDSSWQRARVLGPMGTLPWKEMRERTIPFLTEQQMYPVRVFDACEVEPTKHSYAFDLYEALRESGDGVNPFGVIVGELISDRAGEVTMIRMNATWNLDLFGKLRINGQDIEFPNDRATFTVKEGSNLLIVRFSEKQSQPSWVFETDLDIKLQSPVGSPNGPVAIHSSKEPEDPIVVGCWEARDLNEMSEWFAELRPIRADERYIDIFALSNTRKALPDVRVKIDSAYAMCSSNSEYAVLYPPAEGDLEFLLDFGEEIVGFIEFEIDAEAGTIIDFNCFEAIHLNGTWGWTDNLNNTLRYTAKDGWQRFHSVVRRGFRYAQVTVRGATRPVRVREISCLQNTYPVLNEGEFSCSDALLTSIWDMGRRTTRLCMEDTFVDCPAYEQTFWVGDSRNETLAAYAAFGDTKLAERCLRLAPESIWRSPIPENATPSGYGGIIPDWSLLWAIACEEFYQYTGDRRFVEEISPSILQMCRFILSRRNEKGLWQFSAANMLDWAPMDCPPDAVITHENVLIVETLQRASQLADVIGAADRDELRSEAEAIKAAVNQYLWNEERHAYTDSLHADGSQSQTFSQQTQTMAYLCNCVPPERLSWIEQYIKEVPEGWVKIGSPWMMWFSFEALAKKGDFDTIIDWTRLYWGKMLEYGATTCWETFPPFGNGRWTPTRSWCHAWSAAPTYFLSTCQLGVSFLEPGCKKVRIAPIPCNLTWAKGRVPTPHGTISISWKIEDGRFNLSALLPEGVEAEVVLPEGFSEGEIGIKNAAVSTSPEGEAWQY